MHIDILHHHLQDYKYENTHKKWKEEVTTVIGGQFYKYYYILYVQYGVELHVCCILNIHRT